MDKPAGERRAAIFSALSLLVMAVLAGIGIGYAFPQIYVAGDAAATRAHLLQTPGLFSLFFGCFLSIALLDLLLSFTLYRFFRQVNGGLSLSMGLLRLAYTGLLAVALYALSSVFMVEATSSENQVLIQQGIEQFLQSWSLSLIVFGAHLLLLGLVCLRAGFISRALAGLLLFAGLCYAGIHLCNQFIPDFGPVKEKLEMVLGLPMALGEIWLAMWLLLRGGKARRA